MESVTDSPRIAELRRRVEADPASIAFAQLAEEYRRAGDLERAVEVCRTGLAQYPSYLSARVTLGRALAELGRVEEAAAELERVLQVAPDNVGARRAMEELPPRTATSDAAGGGAPQPTEPGAPGPPAVHAERETPPAAHSSMAPLRALEAWLEAIVRDRVARAGGHAAR